MPSATTSDAPLALSPELVGGNVRAPRNARVNESICAPKLGAPEFMQLPDEAIHGYLLRRVSYGALVQEGGQFMVFEATGCDNLLLKRLRTAAGAKFHLYRQGDKTVEEYFEERRLEHEVFESCFGNRHIPRTRFLTLERSLPMDIMERVVPLTGEPFQIEEHHIDGKDYVMLQSRVTGIAFSPELGAQMPRTISKGMREEVESFLSCYRLMHFKYGKLPEAQFVFDFKNEKIWVVDTNFPQVAACPPDIDTLSVLTIKKLFNIGSAASRAESASKAAYYFGGA